MNKIVLPYDPKWEALTWALKHCSSYITNLATESGEVCYYFANERDALSFALRWV